MKRLLWGLILTSLCFKGALFMVEFWSNNPLVNVGVIFSVLCLLNAAGLVLYFTLLPYFFKQKK